MNAKEGTFISEFEIKSDIVRNWNSPACCLGAGTLLVSKDEVGKLKTLAQRRTPIGLNLYAIYTKDIKSFLPDEWGKNVKAS